MNHEQRERMRDGRGFIAALDQSGGSTPKALRLYGIDETGYSDEAEMFDLVHQMRTRIITSPVFTGERILGAILFEMTMDREIEGQGCGGVPVGGEERRAVPQGRQGAGRGGRRRAGHEADARPGRRAGQGAEPRRVRHQDALGHQDGQRSRRERRGRPAVRGGPAGSSTPDWCRSSSPRSTSTARRRPTAETLLKKAMLAEARRARRRAVQSCSS